jgi:hypothetical protein
VAAVPGGIAQDAGQNFDCLVDERCAGRVDVFDWTGERWPIDLGKVHQEAARVRPDGFLADCALLEWEVTRGRIQFVKQLRLCQDELQDHLVEVVAAEALDALARDHFVPPPGHLHSDASNVPPPRS